MIDPGRFYRWSLGRCFLCNPWSFASVLLLQPHELQTHEFGHAPVSASSFWHYWLLCCLHSITQVQALFHYYKPTDSDIKLTSNIYKMGGGQIALHITHKRWNLELSKLHDWVELASKFIATSLTSEAGSHESDRAEQQDNWFVHYLHSMNVLILSCCPLDQNF